MVFNEKFTLLKTVENRDEFGSISQELQTVREVWCEVIDSSGTFKDTKGGKKRIQFLHVMIWIDKNIDFTYVVCYNGINYNIVNTVHDRQKGVTKIQCEFTN